MASYKSAVSWVACNDAAGDTPEGMDYVDAFHTVRSMISALLVADVWCKNAGDVAIDILRERGFKRPRAFDPDMN